MTLRKPSAARLLPDPHSRSLLAIMLFLFLAASITWPSWSPLSAQARAACPSGCYNILYLMDDNLDNVLEYQEDLTTQLGPEVGRQLKVVGKDDRYGLIYARNGSALSTARIVVRQSEILRRAGLEEVSAIKQDAYHELYNVCYGLGRNLEALKKQYGVIYRYLGTDVAKGLVIEKTDAHNYALVYRRRGDMQSTAAVAQKHAKVLSSIKMTASISPENNNEVIYGESSHLNTEEENLTVGASPARDKMSEPEEKEPGQPQINISALSVASIEQEKTGPVMEIKPAPNKISVNSADDSGLESHLESFIDSLRRTGKIAQDEQTGWLVYDFTGNEQLVDINVERSFQAASMIKPFVALAFFHQVQKGKLKYGPKSRRKMEAMIQRSSNSATNWIMRHVGGPAAAHRILRKNYGDICRTTEIKEYIPCNGRTYRNTASPEDYCRFLRALWQKRLPFGKEIRRLMALPGRDRLYYGTSIPRGTLVYNKTGSTAHLCGDMGILVPRGRDGKRYPYAIVGIIEKKTRPNNYGRWKMTRSNVIREVSSMVYDELRKKYNLL